MHLSVNMVLMLWTMVPWSPSPALLMWAIAIRQKTPARSRLIMAWHSLEISDNHWKFWQNMVETKQTIQAPCGGNKDRKDRLLSQASSRRKRRVGEMWSSGEHVTVIRGRGGKCNVVPFHMHENRKCLHQAQHNRSQFKETGFHWEVRPNNEHCNKS